MSISKPGSDSTSGCLFTAFVIGIVAFFIWFGVSSAESERVCTESGNVYIHQGQKCVAPAVQANR